MVCRSLGIVDAFVVHSFSSDSLVDTQHGVQSFIKGRTVGQVELPKGECLLL